MTIGEAGGEFALIERIRELVGPSPESVRLGIGDDAALLEPMGPAEMTVVTTDLLLEDRHFRRAWCEPYLLGCKAVSVNLSDIAAMGAKPTITLVSLALPPDLQMEWVEALIEGMRDTSARYGYGIVGGDTNAGEQIVLSITQLGRVPSGRGKRRDGAHPGNHIYVTGALGDAAAGFTLLEELGLEKAEDVSPRAVRQQLSPTPRVNAGSYLGSLPDVTAMMDISDGLLADLGKLCQASGVGAVVRADQVAIGSGAMEAAQYLGQNALTWALSGGEDYELLFVARAYDGEDFRRVTQAVLGLPVAWIGEIIAEPGVRLRRGEAVELVSGGGWDHFQRPLTAGKRTWQTRSGMRIITSNPEETEALGQRLATLLQPGDLLCLSGDLGAGKTTFARGLVRGLGSPALVSSPTFTLLHEYDGGRLPIYHGDAYRLTHAAEAASIGLEDYLLRGDGVVMLEWWERIAGALPEERLEIRLTDIGDEQREIVFVPQGARWTPFTKDWADTAPKEDPC